MTYTNKYCTERLADVSDPAVAVDYVLSEGTASITGQHVELTVQSVSNHDLDKAGLKAFLSEQLPNHMVPKRFKVSSVSVGHRFKRT